MKNRPRINMEKTGKRINSLRKGAGISVKEITEKLGYAYPQVIYNWLEGKVIPSADNLVALAYMLNVKVDDLLVTE